MTYTRLILIAFWAFMLGWDIADLDRTWRAFWIVVDVVMVIGLIAYTKRQGDREIEKSRRYPWGRG